MKPLPILATLVLASCHEAVEEGLLRVTRVPAEPGAMSPDASSTSSGATWRDYLKCCPAGALVYVYRPAMLHKRLERTDIADFLHGQGYASLKLSDALATLARHIHCGEEFPHEVGIFLDYPLADVIGFIRHQGAAFCCVGCWKAYTNEEQARRTFALYRKCRMVYLACYHNKGYGVTRLTVAA